MKYIVAILILFTIPLYSCKNHYRSKFIITNNLFVDLFKVEDLLTPKYVLNNRTFFLIMIR